MESKEAHKTARQLGRCMGAISSVLMYGERLNNDTWKTLAKTYLEMVEDDEYHVEHVKQIHDEAKKRKINLN